MEKDATSAGVAPVGGLFSTAEIKILVCYVLTEISEPVPVEDLVNLLHYEGIANAFEVSDAFHSLEKSGMIVKYGESDEYYCITDSGRSVNETLKDSLPNTVKSRALSAAKRMIVRLKNAKNSKIELTHVANDTYITCTVLDRQKPILSIQMLVTDEAQGKQIKERFLDSSSEIFSTVIDLLTCEQE